MDPLTGIAALNAINGVIDPMRQQGMQKDLAQNQYELNLKAMKEQEAAQKRMYEYTGYGSKVRQLKDAGLNPALVYGMGGGGGGVTGNVTAPQVSQGSAPQVGATRNTGIQMMLNSALLESQIDKNKADAELSRSQVPLHGVDTETRGFKLGVDKETREAEIYKRRAESNTSGEHQTAAARENRIGDATEQTQIDQKMKDLILTDRRINLTGAQTDAVIQETKKLFEETKYISKNFEQRQLQIEIGLTNFLKEQTSASQHMSDEEIKDVARNISHVAGMIIGGAIVGAGTKTIQKVDKDGNTTWEQHTGK